MRSDGEAVRDVGDTGTPAAGVVPRTRSARSAEANPNSKDPPAPTFGEYANSGKTLREIYTESCKRYGCKRNSGLHNLLSTKPGEYDTLYEIDLTSNVIGGRGVLALLQVVSTCKALKRLVLRGNSLDHRCVLHIIDVAKTHKSLTHLDLSLNRIGTCGKAVHDLARVNKNITEIGLEGTYIDAYMLKRINERLAANRVAAAVRDGKIPTISPQRVHAQQQQQHTPTPRDPTSLSPSPEADAPSPSPARGGGGDERATSGPSEPEHNTLADKHDAPKGAPDAATPATTTAIPVDTDPAENDGGDTTPPPGGHDAPPAVLPSPPTAASAATVDEKAIEDNACAGGASPPPAVTSTTSNSTPTEAHALQHGTAAAAAPADASAPVMGAAEAPMRIPQPPGVPVDEAGASPSQARGQGVRAPQAQASSSQPTAPRGTSPCDPLVYEDVVGRLSYPDAEGVLPETWWDAAVPIESGDPVQPAPHLHLEGPHEVDWAMFPLADLYDASHYDKYIPMATKLIQMASVSEPHAKIWGNAPVQAMLLRDPSDPSSSDDMSILDYSDATSLNESIDSGDDSRSIQTSEVSEGDLGDAQDQLPPLQWSDHEDSDSDPPVTSPPQAPLTTVEGVATDDVVSLPPPQLEAHLARSIMKLTPEGTAGGSYATLHEKRLTVLNLIFSAAVPKLLEAPMGQALVQHLPPQFHSATNFRRPKRGGEGLRSEAERMDMLFALIDHASASPLAGVAEPISRAVLSALEGIAPLTLAGGAAAPPLPHELTASVQVFLGSTARALGQGGCDAGRDADILMMNVACGLVKLAVARGDVRDILSAVTAARHLPQNMRLPAHVRNTLISLYAVLPHTGGLPMPFVPVLKPTFLPVAEWPDEGGSSTAVPGGLTSLTAVSSDVFVAAKGAALLLLCMSPRRPNSLSVAHVLHLGRPVLTTAYVDDVLWVRTDDRRRAPPHTLSTITFERYRVCESRIEACVVGAGDERAPKSPASAAVDTATAATEAAAEDTSSTTSDGTGTSNDALNNTTGAQREMIDVLEVENTYTGHVYGTVPGKGGKIVMVCEDVDTRGFQFRNIDVRTKAVTTQAIATHTPTQHCLLQLPGGECGLTLGSKSGKYNFKRAAGGDGVATDIPSAAPSPSPLDSPGGHNHHHHHHHHSRVSSVLNHSVSVLQPVTPSPQLTLEVWCRLAPSAMLSSTAIRLLSFSSYSSEVQVTIQSVGGAAFEVRAGHALGRGPAATAEVPRAALMEWCHVALVFRTHTWHLVLNGELVSASPPCAAAPRLSDRGWTLGMGLKGLLTEFRVWDTARSVSEIQRDMCIGMTGGEPHLAAYFPLTDGRGNILMDVVSNQNLTTQRELSAAWANDATILGVPVDGAVEWVTGVQAPIEERAASWPPSNIYILPDLHQLTGSAVPTKIFGYDDKVGIIFPENLFPFGELIRTAKGGGGYSDPTMVLDVTPEGVMTYWAGILAPKEVNLACNHTVTAAVRTSSGATSIVCVKHVAPEPAVGVVIAAEGGSPPLCQWPDADLAECLGLNPEAVAASAAQLHALPNLREGADPEKASGALLTACFRFMDAARTGDGLGFSLPFVADVAPPTFQQLAELPDDAPVAHVYAYLRLATVNINVLVRARIDPSVVLLTGPAPCLQRLIDVAHAVLDSAAGAYPDVVHLAAAAFLCAYVPIWTPTIVDKANYVIANLPESSKLPRSANVRLLGTLKELAADASLGAMVRESHMKSLGQRGHAGGAGGSGAAAGAAGAPSVLTLARVLIAGLGRDAQPLLPMKAVVCTALLQLQKHLGSLAMALHRTVRQRLIPAAGGDAVGAPTASAALAATGLFSNAAATNPGVPLASGVPGHAAGAGASTGGAADPSPCSSGDMSAPSTTAKCDDVSPRTAATAAAPPQDEGLLFMKALFFPYMRDLFAAAVADLAYVQGNVDAPKPQVLSQAFPAFVGILPLLNGYSEEFLKGLARLLPLFADASRIVDVKDSERRLLSGEGLATRTFAVQRVVSAVSRPGDAAQTQKVCIPGASSLTLSFDPQWTLGSEKLVVHLPGRDPETEGEPLGANRRWPDEPVIFTDTDTLVFQFDPTGSTKSEHRTAGRGFRITVTGQVAYPYPSLHWLHDVVLGLLFTAARVCHALTSSYSVPCTPIDDALVSWITDLTLDADAATEPHAFWQSIVDNVGAGGKLVAKLMAKNLPTAQPHLGGEPINHTLRAIFSALLCHLGISPMKFQEAVMEGDEPPRTAVRLWRKVEELRHWLLELRQKSKNARLDDEDKSTQHGGACDPIKDAYGRAMVLLRHPPSGEIAKSLSAGIGDPAVTTPLMTTNTLSDLMRSESTTEIRRMSGLLRRSVPSSIVTRLRRMMRKSKNATSNATPEKREAQLFQFFQDERVTAAHFDDFVAKRKLLGKRRLFALNVFEKLLFEYSVVPSSPPADAPATAGPAADDRDRGAAATSAALSQSGGDIASDRATAASIPPAAYTGQPLSTHSACAVSSSGVSGVSPGCTSGYAASLPSANPGLVRAFIRSIKGHHYLDNLSCCGREVEATIQSDVYSIVSRLAQRLSIDLAPGCDGGTEGDLERVELFLDLMSCAWKGADYGLVLGLDVLSTIRRLLEHTSAQGVRQRVATLRAKAWHVLQLLALRAAMEAGSGPSGVGIAAAGAAGEGRAEGHNSNNFAFGDCGLPLDVDADIAAHAGSAHAAAGAGVDAPGRGVCDAASDGLQEGLPPRPTPPIFAASKPSSLPAQDAEKDKDKAATADKDTPAGAGGKLPAGQQPQAPPGGGKNIIIFDQQVDAESEGDSDAGRDYQQVFFLKKVVAAGIEELHEQYEVLLDLHVKYNETKRKLSKLRARLDEADHRIRVDRIRCRLLRHGSSSGAGGVQRSTTSSRRNSPSVDQSIPKSPTATDAKEFRRSLKSPLRHERTTLRNIETSLTFHAGQAAAWLGFITALLSASPSAMVEIVTETSFLTTVFKLLTGFDPRRNAEVAKICFSFLRLALPYTTPRMADAVVAQLRAADTESPMQHPAAAAMSPSPDDDDADAVPGLATVNFLVDFAAKYGVLHMHKRHKIVKAYLAFAVDRATSRLLRILLQQPAWNPCVLKAVAGILVEDNACWLRRRPDGSPVIPADPDGEGERTTPRGNGMKRKRSSVVLGAGGQKAATATTNAGLRAGAARGGDDQESPAKHSECGFSGDGDPAPDTAAPAAGDSGEQDPGDVGKPAAASGAKAAAGGPRRAKVAKDTTTPVGDEGERESGREEQQEQYTSASDDADGDDAEVREAKRKARRLQRRRSRMQRRTARGDFDESGDHDLTEVRDADGFTRADRTQRRRLDIALAVIGGGEVRVCEGRLATCRLRKGARQHVITQRINDTVAIVVPVTAKGSFLASRGIKSKTDALVDVAHNPAREVHTDRLVLGLSELLSTSEVANMSMVLPALCGLLSTVLEPCASLAAMLSYHLPAGGECEPLLRLPSLKLSQLKKRIAQSKLLPSVLRGLHASLAGVSADSVREIVSSGIVMLLCRVCTLRIEMSDPVPFQHLGEMCALMNWVLPHRSKRAFDAAALEEEEEDDVSDRDEFEDDEEDEEHEEDVSQGGSEEVLCAATAQHLSKPLEEGWDDDGADEATPNTHPLAGHHPHAHHKPESLHSDDMPDVVSEYHFATFLEGTDEGMTDDEAWEGCSDANDSDQENAYIVFKRTDVLKRLCVEQDIRREAWKFDSALAWTFAARVVLQLLAASPDGYVWEEQHVGPPLLVLKFLAKGAAMAYRGQLDQESLTRGLEKLLRSYESRSALASLLVQQALRLVDVEYSGPQLNNHHLGLLFLEAVAASELSHIAFTVPTVTTLIAHVHTSVGWGRRQLLILLSRLFHTMPPEVVAAPNFLPTVDRRLIDLEVAYRRQLAPEMESKSGTGEILSMYLQALIALFHARNCAAAMTERGEDDVDDDAGSVLPCGRPIANVPEDEATQNGVTNLLSTFARAARSFTAGDDTVRGMPRTLLEGAEHDVLPDGWLRYGGPIADLLVVGVGVNLRGLWVDPAAVEAAHGVRTSISQSVDTNGSAPGWKRGIDAAHGAATGPAGLILSGAGAKVRVESFSNFATVMANVSVGRGSWYWEVEIESCCLMQAGWVDPRKFTCDSEGGHGVGDDAHSWAYDGMRNCTWHARRSRPYAHHEDAAGENKSSRDGDAQRRRRAAEKRRRKRQKARRRRRLQNASSASVLLATTPSHPAMGHTSPLQAVPTVIHTNVTRERDTQHGSVERAGRQQHTGAGHEAEGFSDSQWDEPDCGDDSTEGEWMGDDSAFLSCDGADETADGDEYAFEDDAIHPNGPGGWKPGDVVGCAITITEDKKATMSFSLNGHDLRVAFDDVAMDGLGVNPAASLRSGDVVVINLGGAPFRHCPAGHRGLTAPLGWLAPVISGDVAPGEPFPKKPCAEAAALYSEAWHKAVGHGPIDISASNTEGERKRAQVFDMDEGGMLRAVKEPRSGWSLAVTARFNVLAKLVMVYVSQEAAMPPVLGQAGRLAGQRASLVGLFTRARDVLFPWAKEPLMEGIVTGACREGRVASILLSRNYFAQAGKGAAGPGTSEGLFDQLHALYRSKRPWAFQSHESCDASARLWTVVFEGEAAEDAGGPFRESLTTVCEELMDETPHSLFISSPNHKGNFGDTRDKWIPRPSAAAAGVEHDLLVSKFRFLGRLMAGCLSINEPMNLSFSSIVWKALTDTPVERSDLAAVDQMCLNAVDGVMNIASKGITPELFKDAIDERFVTTLSDGSEVELIDGGRDIEVSFERREEYGMRVIEARLHESWEYLTAMREGFLDVVPGTVLSLFTWRGLERRVCGSSDISVHDLRACAIYEDIDEGGATVARFWEALMDFTQKDLTNLLRFVAARSRLPVALKLQPYIVDGDPNAYLPQAHTCFFSLELPEYSSTAIMREKLLYAIYNCRAIDTDGAPVGLEDMDADDDEDEFEYEDSEEYL